ncbi:MAG TPA: RNase adapter RapZ [Acidimicrobiales bacterium]|jgi:UPF0042 nucleotide-binding protein|nr:RNase adapter RapZ [Acidimicrobiales bacterium]
MADFVIITGMSGAGRSQAGATFEDLGWFVVDNLPTALILDFASLIEKPDSGRDKVVLVVGRDTSQLGDLAPAVDELRRRGTDVRTLYLDARDDVLVRRFEGTRRRHPLGREKVLEAIADERQRLASIRESADLVIDTSDLNVNQLRDRLVAVFREDGDEVMQISVVSFGFKYGLPPDVDNVFDVRFLPNPHWVAELRDLTGLDAPVRNYVLASSEADEFVGRIDDLLAFLLPCYVHEGKAYVTVAVGCTGGRHRSVVLAEEIAGRIRNHGFGAAVFHRDISR